MQHPTPFLLRATSQTIVPEAASGWLRFGVMALPKTAPPPSAR